ncbi:MAG: DUF4259 domain-containing protein [Pseudomonadota bacterium]
MGAWGAGSFENDDAQDWIWEFEAEGVSAVEAVFMSTREAFASGYVESPEASMSIAAAELIAAAHGKPMALDGEAGQIDREILKKALGDHADDVRARRDLPKLALEVLAMITASEETSELLGLWSDAGAEEFLANVDDLRQRLRAVE